MYIGQLNKVDVVKLINNARLNKDFDLFIRAILAYMTDSSYDIIVYKRI